MATTYAGTTQRMPSLYIPHGGGPCFFMDWNPPDLWNSVADFLKGIAVSLPQKPRAILLISAHWVGREFMIGSVEKPGLLYDYYNFPPNTYQLKYPAPGAPSLAVRALELLQQAGIKAIEDPQRGFDHGVFIPLKLAFPDAEIPIATMSLKAGYDPASHLAAGAALETLRDEGVLIIGSGMSFHNMRGFVDPSFHAQSVAYSTDFTHWLDAAVTAPEPAARAAELTHWETAPSARLSHPPRGEEHLIPLLIAAGAAGTDQGSIIYKGDVGGIRIAAYRFG